MVQNYHQISSSARKTHFLNKTKHFKPMNKVEKSERLRSIFENTNSERIRRRIDEYASHFTTGEYEKMAFMSNLLSENPSYISHLSEKDITLLDSVVGDIEEADIITEDEFLALTDSVLQPIEISSINYYIIDEHILTKISEVLFSTFGTVSYQDLLEVEYTNPGFVASVIIDVLQELGVYSQSINEAAFASYKRSIYENGTLSREEIIYWAKSLSKDEADHIYRTLYKSKPPRNSREIILRDVCENPDGEVCSIFRDTYSSEKEFSIKGINESLESLRSVVKIEDFRSLVYSASPVMIVEGIDGSRYKVWGSICENYERL